MRDPVPQLKEFCEGIFKKKNLPSPIKVELFDIGSNFTYEMEARVDSEGKWSYPTERAIPGTVQRPGPYKVKFTVEGESFFWEDFDPK